jgi:hypothetical protein
MYRSHSINTHAATSPYHFPSTSYTPLPTRIIKIYRITFASASRSIILIAARRLEFSMITDGVVTEMYNGRIHIAHDISKFWHVNAGLECLSIFTAKRLERQFCSICK